MNKMPHTDSVQQNYAVCCVPVSPMRQEPSHRTEMVSQQLFGECCTIIEEAKDHWVKIKSRYDGYEGWCQDSQVIPVDERVYTSEVKSLTADWISEIIFDSGKMMIPMGCSLPGMKESSATWNNHDVLFEGNFVDTGTIARDEANITRFAYRFLNTSYLWGGKSVFGVDCSGFTQTVYKFLDFPLPRDAYQQASEGRVVDLAEARCGDLAFFDNADGKITHVGIILNDNKIIHSSGKVRIDKIDSAGIMNQESLTRTHLLKIIKRYF